MKNRGGERQTRSFSEDSSNSVSSPRLVIHLQVSCNCPYNSTCCRTGKISEHHLRKTNIIERKKLSWREYLSLYQVKWRANPHPWARHFLNHWLLWIQSAPSSSWLLIKTSENNKRSLPHVITWLRSGLVWNIWSGSRHRRQRLYNKDHRGHRSLCSSGGQRDRTI